MPYIGVNKGDDLGAWKGSGVTVDVIPGQLTLVVTAVASGNAGHRPPVRQQGGRGHRRKGSTPRSSAPQHCPGGRTSSCRAKREDVTKPEQLKGAKFGVSGFGSGGHYATLKLAERLGWGKDDYEVVQLGGLPEMTAALESGAMNAFIWNPIETATIKEEGLGHVIGSVNDYISATACSTSATTRSRSARGGEGVLQGTGLVQRLHDRSHPAARRS